MSIITVRKALRDYIAAGCASGAVPGVSEVYKAIPWFVAGSQWELSDSFGSGSIVFLHLEDKGETRAADPAEGFTPRVAGVKQVGYQVDAVVLYQYLILSGADADAVRPDVWIDPLDATMQGLKDWIHADPTAGTGPVEGGGDGSLTVFEMGQDPDDLRVAPQLPRATPGKIWTWPVLQFSAYEYITA